jgi:hypothetical protein
MAYYIDDKEIVKNVDINYILDYFKSKGETCIRIMRGRSFPLLPSGKRVEKIENSIIIEPIGDKSSYVYQDGSRTVSIDRERGSICINPYFDKSGSYDNDHSLSKDLQEYILDYPSYLRNKKINEII